MTRVITVGLVLMALFVSSGAQPRSAGALSAQTTKDQTNPLLSMKALVSMCQKDNKAIQGFCGAYIHGFVDGAAAALEPQVIKSVADDVYKGRIAPTDEAMGKDFKDTVRREFRKRGVCIQSIWTGEYVASVIAQYGREHANEPDEAPVDVMFKVLARAFPCSSNEVKPER